MKNDNGIKIKLPQETINRLEQIKLLEQQIKYFEFLLKENIEVQPRLILTDAKYLANSMVEFSSLGSVIHIQSLTEKMKQDYRMIINKNKEILNKLKNYGESTTSSRTENK